MGPKLHVADVATQTPWPGWGLSWDLQGVQHSWAHSILCQPGTTLPQFSDILNYHAWVKGEPSPRLANEEAEAQGREGVTWGHRYNYSQDLSPLPACLAGTELPRSFPPALIIQDSYDQREMGGFVLFFLLFKYVSLQWVLLSSIQQSDFFCRLYFIIGCYKALSVVACAVQ